MTMMPDETKPTLLPCPSRQKVPHVVTVNRGVQDVWVLCSCGFAGPRRSSDEEAIEAWAFTSPPVPDAGETPETDAFERNHFSNAREGTFIGATSIWNFARSLERRLRATLSRASVPAPASGGDTEVSAKAWIVATAKALGMQDPEGLWDSTRFITHEIDKMRDSLHIAPAPEPTGPPIEVTMALDAASIIDELEKRGSAPTPDQKVVQVLAAALRSRLSAAPSLTDEEREAMAEELRIVNPEIPQTNAGILARALSRVTGKGVEG